MNIPSNSNVANISNSLITALLSIPMAQSTTVSLVPAKAISCPNTDELITSRNTIAVTDTVLASDF